MPDGNLRSGPGAERVSDWTGAPATAAEDARSAAYYDFQYGFSAGDAPWPDVEWFRSVASGAGGPVLELGCGSGRIAVALAGDGHTVVGLDRSPAMLVRAAERAREARVVVELVVGDLRDFTLGRRFALVVIPFNTFLMVPPDDRRSCLLRIREHLEPGGLLAIDVFQPDPSRIAGVDGGVVDEGSAGDPRTGERLTFFTSTRATVDRTAHVLRVDAVDADGVVRRHERVLTLHFLYRREAELQLAMAGFEVVSLHGDHEGTPADEHAARLLIVARRRDRGPRGERRR